MICSECKQDMRVQPHRGMHDKDCSLCGQGIQWRRRLAIERRKRVMAVEQINEVTEVKMMASLHDAFEEWWPRFCSSEDFENVPWIGERTYFLMARAAIGILLANKDVEVFMDSNGYLAE